MLAFFLYEAAAGVALSCLVCVLYRLTPWSLKPLEVQSREFRYKAAHLIPDEERQKRKWIQAQRRLRPKEERAQRHRLIWLEFLVAITILTWNATSTILFWSSGEGHTVHGLILLCASNVHNFLLLGWKVTAMRKKGRRPAFQRSNVIQGLFTSSLFDTLSIAATCLDISLYGWSEGFYWGLGLGTLNLFYSMCNLIYAIGPRGCRKAGSAVCGCLAGCMAGCMAGCVSVLRMGYRYETLDERI